MEMSFCHEEHSKFSCSSNTLIKHAGYLFYLCFSSYSGLEQPLFLQAVLEGFISQVSFMVSCQHLEQEVYMQNTVGKLLNSDINDKLVLGQGKLLF